MIFGKDRLKLNIGLCLALALLGLTMCTRVSFYMIMCTKVLYEIEKLDCFLSSPASMC